MLSEENPMVRNKRDLGGIRTSTGMSIRPGCLYRSANLHNAIPEDLIGVSEVIDFRTNLEEEKMPDTLPDGITYHRVPIFTESAAGITREGNVSEVPDMVNLYRTMLTDEGCRKQLKEILTIIFQHDFGKGAILWHCTAGKDRCGIVTALVLTALGVNRESIMRDYLLSNEDCLAESDEVYRRLVDMGMPLDNAEAVRAAFLAEPAYLEAALEAYDLAPLDFPDFDSFKKQILSA